MSEIVCYTPTYSPDTEADTEYPRLYERLTQEQIKEHVASGHGRKKPGMYLDAIDSVLNIRPDITLVVGDGRSTESIRHGLIRHHSESGGYKLELYEEKMSQWAIFNDIMKKHSTIETKYFIYSSSDVLWHHDWVGEAIKAFEANPKLQILFPFVNQGDPNLPCQISDGPKDIEPFIPPFQDHARAPVLNAYAMIFRMDFLRAYGGYPTVFRNCFTESFLAYMCEAIGGEMRVLPRGHVFHHGEGDKWVSPGSAYYYTEEKLHFQEIMNNVLMYRAMKRMTPELLKTKLYKQER